MNRTQARNHINNLIGIELERARRSVGGYDTYVCPFCGNGKGTDGTGICTRDGSRYKCFKCGCFGDYLDILKKKHCTDREGDVFKLYGLTIDDGRIAPPSRPMPPSHPTGVHSSTYVPQPVSSPKEDCTEFFKDAHASLLAEPSAISYLQWRGISMGTAIRFQLGYCGKWRSPAAVKAGRKPPPSRRIIIPTSRTGYTARDIDSAGNDNFRFMKHGEAGYFGQEALHGVGTVFIVEGAIDALSIYEVGGVACALGSTSGIGKFLELLDSICPVTTLVLTLDNDNAGKAAQEKLKSGLAKRKLSFFEAILSGKYKDPNEALQRDRAALESFVAFFSSSQTLAATTCSR